MRNQKTVREPVSERKLSAKVIGKSEFGGIEYLRISLDEPYDYQLVGESPSAVKTFEIERHRVSTYVGEKGTTNLPEGFFREYILGQYNLMYNRLSIHGKIGKAAFRS